jgi:hypothetical protein
MLVPMGVLVVEHVHLQREVLPPKQRLLGVLETHHQHHHHKEIMVELAL